MRNNKTTPKGKKAAPSENTNKRKVTAAIKELPDNFLECRSYRYHAFKKVRIFEWADGNAKGVCRISKCTRCGMGRDDYYNRKGELVDRSYDPPIGYSLSGYGPLTNDKVMRELFFRASEIAPNESSVNATVTHLSLARTRP